MTMRPHPDWPTVLRALTLMTWELPSWKIWSFWNATSWEVGGGAFWSPLLQSGASSSLAWGSCSGAGVFAFEASAGQGWHWAGVRAGQRRAWGLGWDRQELGGATGGQGQACAHWARPSQGYLWLRLEAGLRTDWGDLSSAVLVWVWRMGRR